MALTILTVIAVVVGIVGCVLSIVWLSDARADMRAINVIGRGNMKAQKLMIWREIWGARLACAICAFGVVGGAMLSVPVLTAETRMLITLGLATLAEMMVVTAIATVTLRKWQAAKAIRDELARQRVHESP